MILSHTNNASAIGRWIRIPLLAFALLLLTSVPAMALDCIADAGGVIDGFVNYPVPPANINIDGNCTIRNYPASNPLTSNIAFFGSTNQTWVVIFDNVYHTGSMACNRKHRIWFANSSSSDIHQGCANLLIPIEKIDKENPPGPPYATIGVPFTYSLTIPVLFDPATGTVINTNGSPNDLHGITVTDDLNATGADLTYVSHRVYWLDTGALVPHTFSNVGGFLTFDNFPIVPAGDQFVIEITVVLDNTLANAPGTTFINTAKWDFGRLIRGVFYEPLPGEWGITPPMTIAGPEIVVNKSGPATMNLGVWGDFVIDVQNIGLTTAWDISLRDLLPDGPTGGMCDLTPQITGAQVYQANGTTPVPGKGPLIPGVDYLLTWSGAPNCRLDMRMLTPAGSVGPTERLIIRYRTQLDVNTQNGVALTNVAGAIQWFNGDASNPGRIPETHALTNGTVGILDHEDAHTVTTALTGYFFEKTAANLTTGVNPTTTASPGDTLRYTLSLRTTSQALTNFSIRDDLGALNALPAFVPGTLSLVSYPAGADISNTSSTGGTNGTGLIDIRNLNLPAFSQLVIQFDITLALTLPNGTVVTNQSASRLSSGAIFALSDDPNVNGTANPSIPGDEDPTRVTILAVAPSGFVFDKTAANLTSGVNPATTASPGDTLRYTLRFRIGTQALNNFSIRDELDALNALPAFVPGTMTLVSYPAGADISNTSSTGGANGTGVIDIRNLSLPAAGELVIQFDVTLDSGLPNGTVVTNQSTLRLANGATVALSDDPNVNGTADPLIQGDEDPTRVTIVSGASFLVQKISTDMTGDPAVLLAGETLRYTITVKNIGNDDATGVILRDAVPVNTTYVAGSTTLNGAPVADVAGLSPLVNGMLINSPADPTPGSMPADSSSNPANVATITFDVVIDPSVVNGTVISNQGFVTASDNGIFNRPSDDPDTSTPDDPTRDIVGNLPLLYAEKSVVLVNDLGTPGLVDPGDTLRYTITMQNSGAIPSTGVVLRDTVPANTTYDADTTFLNGLPVRQPDNGVSPLASGIDISSSDLTPPLPGPGAGTISPGQTAVLQFDLIVNLGTPAGTLISNQAVVESVELPDLPTDGDGNPSTGPEPTVVVVGGGQQLSITKQVAVVGGGAALPGSQLEYIVTVVNIAAVPALNVVLTDNLDASQPGQLAYVNLSATMNGSSAGVSFAGTTITANYAAVNGPLQPGETVVLRFRATLNPTLVAGTVVTNTGVVAWNNPTQTASASVSIVVGGIPGVAVLGGSAWHDADFDDTRDAGERPLAGWAVDLYLDNQLSHTAITDTNGAYRITGVQPNDVNPIIYELRFRAPGAGANTALLGYAASPFTNGMQQISDIIVPSSANLQNLHMPIQPNGVVYNSMSRTPIVGATLTLQSPGSSTPLPAACFDDVAQQGQVTLADGYYKFDVNFSDQACPNGGDYMIAVTPPPGATYTAGYSQIIPPMSDASTPAFSVPACPGTTNDTIPGTALYCEVQPSEFSPPASVPPRTAGTIHHVHVTLDGVQMPGTSQIFNNHIPIDPLITGSLAITKTTPLLNVSRGQMVPYVITVNNVSGMAFLDVDIVDRVPAGFAYVEGSALLDGVQTEPVVTNHQLRWEGLVFAGTEIHTVKLLLAVGAGVTEGEYENRAQAVDGATFSAMSGEATATVRVVPDPTFDCTDVTGKVFNDVNRNGQQDDGEVGLPGVRVVTPRGLTATTDPFGRYHITCAIVPNEVRGSNFVLKLDDRTLPSGFRMSTDQVQIKRATRGKTLKVNFGASIHRVVSIDLSDAAFEPGTTDIRIQWRPRLDLLLEELRKAPALLRLCYVADTEDAALVQRRMETIKRQVTEAWDAADSGYALTIEPEVFWRRGAPPKQPKVGATEGR